MNGNGNANWYKTLISFLAGVIFSVLAGYWPLVTQISALGQRITALEIKIDLLVAKK